MKNTKPVTIEKLSDNSLKNISGGMIGDISYFLIGGFFQGILRISVSGLLIICGGAGAIGGTIASIKQFSNSNPAAGVGLATGAAASAGIAATGVVLLKKTLS